MNRMPHNSISVPLILMLALTQVACGTIGRDLAAGNREEARQRLMRGDDPNGRTDFTNNTVLHHAAGDGDIEIVQLALAKGALVDLRDGRGNTALIWAARRDGLLDVGQRRDRLSTVKLLLEKGASVNVANDYGHTPLHAALSKRADSDATSIAQVLLAHGASIDPTTNREGTTTFFGAAPGIDSIPAGATPLMLASRSGNLQIATELLSQGANLQARDQRGWSPLHFAAMSPNAEIAGLLLDRGAIPSRAADDWRSERATGRVYYLSALRNIAKGDRIRAIEDLQTAGQSLERAIAGEQSAATSRAVLAGLAAITLNVISFRHAMDQAAGAAQRAARLSPSGTGTGVATYMVVNPADAVRSVTNPQIEGADPDLIWVNSYLACVKAATDSDATRACLLPPSLPDDGMETARPSR